jgi:hypothetical protein
MLVARGRPAAPEVPVRAPWERTKDRLQYVLQPPLPPGKPPAGAVPSSRDSGLCRDGCIEKRASSPPGSALVLRNRLGRAADSRAISIH